jgi:MFS family permease
MAPRAPLITQWPLQRMMLMATTGFTGFYVMLSALPAWIASRGSSAAAAGAATTVMLATTAVCQPFVPALLRRLSTTAAVAIGMLALGIPAPLLALTGSGVGLYVICAIRGIGFAIFTIAGTLATAEIAPEGRLGEVAGLYGLAAAIPNVGLVPLSVLLLHVVGFWPVAVISAMPVLGAALAIGAGGRRAEDHARPRRTGDARAAVGRSLAPAAVLCSLTVAGGAVVTILPIERPGLVATAGLAVFGAVGAGSRWLAGMRVRRHGVAVLLPLACASAAAGLIVIAAALSGSPAAVALAGCALAGAGYGAVQSLTLVAVFDRTDRPARPVASAVWNVAFDSGTAIGAVLIGVLEASSLGIWGAFSVLAALALATIPAGVASGRGRP